MSAEVKNQPFDCTVNNLVNKLADWYKPGDTKEIRQSRAIFKYNSFVTLNNVGLVGVITGLALACFSGYAIFGLVMAAAFALNNWMMTSKRGLMTEVGRGLDDLRMPTPKDWHPSVATFGHPRVSWFRCFPSPKTDDKKAGGVAEPVPESEEKGERVGFGDRGFEVPASFTVREGRVGQ